MITFFVGDGGLELSLKAKTMDSSAQLLTEDTCNDINPGVYYISLGDFSNDKEFVSALRKADWLIYSPPVVWDNADMQYWTEYHLLRLKNITQVTGLDVGIPVDKNVMLELADNRKTEDRQLWSVGCSVTHGQGVTTTQRYGQLIADYMQLPASFLTCSGSSITWAADQILRSDIRKNDIVIWGLPNWGRIPYYDSTTKIVKHVTPWYYDQYPNFITVISPDRLSDHDLLYQSITSIYQVINFCNKIEAKLIIAGLLIDNDFISYTTNIPNYIHLFDTFIDVGNDNKHPGPLTHKWYSEEIINGFKL